MISENGSSHTYRNGYINPNESLADVLRPAGEFEINRFERRHIRIEQINVLPQGRKTFEDIDRLAENIAEHGIMNLPVVATYDSQSAYHHLEVINSMWSTSMTLEDLKPSIGEDGEVTYHILVAGERRFRACNKLLEEGIYEKKFGSTNLEVSTRYNMPPMEAVFLQASENTYLSVPPHEEAVYYDKMFSLIRIANPDYPLAQFARKVGRSESKIRDALRFCLLPPQIQDYVRDGYISYGIGCEIARLAQAEAGVDELEHFANKALTGRFRVDQFKGVVNDYFNNRDGNMFDIFKDEQFDENRKAAFKKVVKKEFVMGLWSFIHYFKHVLQLFETGKLGQEHSPFSDGSPRRFFAELLTLEKQLLPHFGKVMTRPEYEKAESILCEIEEQFGDLHYNIDSLTQGTERSLFVD